MTRGSTSHKDPFQSGTPLPRTPRDRIRRLPFPPLQVAQVVALACSPPSAYGLALQRWTYRDLQYQILSEGIVTEIYYTTVHSLLADVDLQPHRTLYWKHPVAPDFEEKAASVLWYYERVECLEAKEELVFCLDEKTQIQALSPPHPDLPAQPGCPSHGS